MTFRPTALEVERLDKLTSSYRFIHSGQQGDAYEVQVPICRAEIIHKLTAKPYAQAPGNDRRQALAAALDEAESVGTPLLSDEDRQRNESLKVEADELRDKVASLKGELAEAQDRLRKAKK